MATRFVTYGVEITGEARAYQQALLANAAVMEWAAEGEKETEFFAPDEPYAEPPK